MFIKNPFFFGYKIYVYFLMCQEELIDHCTLTLHLFNYTLFPFSYKRVNRGTRFLRAWNLSLSLSLCRRQRAREREAKIGKGKRKESTKAPLTFSIADALLASLVIATNLCGKKWKCERNSCKCNIIYIYNLFTNPYKY